MMQLIANVVYLAVVVMIIAFISRESGIVEMIRKWREKEARE